MHLNSRNTRDKEKSTFPKKIDVLEKNMKIKNSTNRNKNCPFVISKKKEGLFNVERLLRVPVAHREYFREETGKIQIRVERESSK